VTFGVLPGSPDKEHPKAKPPKEVSMMTDDELRRHVSDELGWDPKIDGSELAVSAEDGVVTMRGTVGSFRQKREARKAAERVCGVIDVTNQLEVRILTEQRREDAEVRGDVLQALLLDAYLPTSVDATVKSGFVTLTGAVDWEYQRNEAIFIAGNVLGVTGVDDHGHTTVTCRRTVGRRYGAGVGFRAGVGATGRSRHSPDRRGVRVSRTVVPRWTRRKTPGPTSHSGRSSTVASSTAT
jgi:osmotically-inducible protein OsmY